MRPHSKKHAILSSIPSGLDIFAEKKSMNDNAGAKRHE